jgi:hypothetical protein
MCWNSSYANNPAINAATKAATIPAGRKSPGEQAADFAIKCADDINAHCYKELSSKMCWDAVILCAYNSQAISKKMYEAMKDKITTEKYSAFIANTDPVIDNADAMRKVPKGSYLGFIEISTNKLIHAMIATGDGYAAGNKNSCIGIGRPVGWENLNIADGLNWMPEFKCVNAVPKEDKSVQRRIKIQYRALSLSCGQ